MRLPLHNVALHFGYYEVIELHTSGIRTVTAKVLHFLRESNSEPIARVSSALTSNPHII